MEMDRNTEILSFEDRLIPEDYNMGERPRVHTRARLERPDEYPVRFPVAEGTTWENLDKSVYHPAEYTKKSILDKGGELDASERPLNPVGPTGITGRGRLYSYGPNFAADPIVTFVDSDGKLNGLFVTRKGGSKALAGGFVDAEDSEPRFAAQRELWEETNVKVNFEMATDGYEGYVDDPRNTDNAWVETSAFHVHLEDKDEIERVLSEIKPSEEVADAYTRVIDAVWLSDMYANHRDIILRSVAQWQKDSGNIVKKDGTVVFPKAA